MPHVYRGRYTAHLDGDFVVFLIGMRVNRPWKVHKWWPVFRAMAGMVKYLRAHPEAGLLRADFTLIAGVGPAVVQYWRGFEDLERFARGADAPHLAAWRAFNTTVKASGDVGIWHETYHVGAGSYETMYANMPRIGLAAAGELLPAERKGHTAAARLGRSVVTPPPVAPYGDR